MAAPPPLPPTLRRVVGSLLLLAGVLMALGLALRLGVYWYLSGRAGLAAGSGGHDQALLGLGLVTTAGLLYAGRQLRRR